jgi:hypothetical protein
MIQLPTIEEGSCQSAFIFIAAQATAVRLASAPEVPTISAYELVGARGVNALEEHGKEKKMENGRPLTFHLFGIV